MSEIERENLPDHGVKLPTTKREPLSEDDFE